MAVITKEQWEAMPTAQRVAIRRKMVSQRRKAEAFNNIMAFVGTVAVILLSGEVK